MKLKQLDYSSIVSANSARAAANSAKLGTEVMKSDARYAREQGFASGMANLVDGASTFKTIIDQTNSAKFSQAQTEYSLVAQKAINDLADAGKLYNDDWSLTDEAKGVISRLKADIDNSEALSGLNKANKTRLKDYVQEQFNSTYENRVQAQTKAENLLGQARANASSLQLDQAINEGVNKFASAYASGAFAEGFEGLDISQYVDLDGYLSTVDGWNEMSQEEKLEVVQSEISRNKGSFFYNAMLSIVDNGGVTDADKFIRYLGKNGYISAEEVGKYRAMAASRQQSNLELAMNAMQSDFNAALEQDPASVVTASDQAKASAESLTPDMKAEALAYADKMVMDKYMTSDEYASLSRMLPSEQYKYYESLETNQWYVSLSDEGKAVMRNDIKSKLMEGYDSIETGLADYVENIFTSFSAALDAGTVSASYVIGYAEDAINSGDFTENAKQMKIYQDALDAGYAEDEALQVARNEAQTILNACAKAKYEQLLAKCDDTAKTVLSSVMDDTWGTFSSGLTSAQKREIDAYIWQYAIDWIYDNGNSNASTTELKRTVEGLQDAITGKVLDVSKKNETKRIADVYKGSPNKDAMKAMQTQYDVLDRFNDNGGLFINSDGKVVTYSADARTALDSFTRNTVQLLNDNILGDTEVTDKDVFYSQDIIPGKFTVCVNVGDSSYAVMPNSNGLFMVYRTKGKNGAWEPMGELDKKGNTDKGVVTPQTETNLLTLAPKAMAIIQERKGLSDIKLNPVITIDDMREELLKVSDNAFEVDSFLKQYINPGTQGNAKTFNVSKFLKDGNYKVGSLIADSLEDSEV